MIIQHQDPKDNLLHIFWVTDNKIDEEYESFSISSKYFKKYKPQIFKSVKIIMNKIEKIEFENTYIIITENMFEEFISEFLNKIIEIKVIPKFIIYTRDKTSEKNNNNNSYYKYGGKHSSFKEIFDFIKKDLIIQNNDISSFNDTLGFNSKLYVDKQEQNIKLILDTFESLNSMYLPTYFKIMIKIKEEDKKEIPKFTRKIYDEYKEIINKYNIYYPK